MMDPRAVDEALSFAETSPSRTLVEAVLAAEVRRLREVEKRARVVGMYGTDAVRPTAHWILYGPPVADPEEVS